MRMSRASRGSGLVELMLAIALGLGVLLALLGFYLGAVRSYAERQAELELRLSLVALLDRVEGEIRRSGYSGEALALQLAKLPLDRPYPWQPAEVSVAGVLLPNETCLLLRSDLNGDGVLGDEELAGYRFNGEHQRPTAARPRSTPGSVAARHVPLAPAMHTRFAPKAIHSPDYPECDNP